MIISGHMKQFPIGMGNFSDKNSRNGDNCPKDGEKFPM